MVRVDVLPAQLLEQLDRGLLDELVFGVAAGRRRHAATSGIGDVEVGDVDLAGDEAGKEKVAGGAKSHRSRAVQTSYDRGRAIDARRQAAATSRCGQSTSLICASVDSSDVAQRRTAAHA